MRKWSYRILFVFLLLLLGAIIYVEVNKDELARQIIESVNSDINGSLDYQSSEISLFRSFPRISLRFSNVELNRGEANNVQSVFFAEKIDCNFSIPSLIFSSSEIIIDYFAVANGTLSLSEDKYGQSNFRNILSSTEESNEVVELLIKEFAFENCELIYLNDYTDQHFRLGKLQWKGRASFEESGIYASSDLEGRIYYRQSPVIPAINLDLAANSQIHLSNSFDTITLEKTYCTINNLPLDVESQLILTDKSYLYEVIFAIADSKFKNIVSLIPVYYKNNFEDLQADGTIYAQGKVQGDSESQYPRYDIEVSAENGSVRYPGLPNQIEGIQFNLHLFNDNSTQAFERINIANLQARSEKSNIDGDIQIDNKQGQQNILGELTFGLDLKDLSECFATDGSDEMEGTIRGNISGRSDSNQLYSDLSGSIQLSNIQLNREHSAYSMREGQISIEDEILQYRLDEVNFSELSNLNSYGTLKVLNLPERFKVIGQGSIDIDYLSIPNEYANNSDSLNTSFTDLPEIEMILDVNVKHLKYGAYDVKGIRSTSEMQDNLLVTNATIGDFNGSKIVAKGKFEHLIDYISKEDTVKGEIQLQFDQLILDSLLRTSDDVVENNDELLFPSDIDLEISYTGDKVLYHGIDLSRIIGDLNIRGEKIILNNQASLFGGSIEASGIIEPSNSDSIQADLVLSLGSLSFQETAKKVNLFSKFIPIAKFLEGEYTASLHWSSLFDKQYVPDLNSLNAIGTIETSNGAINGVLPLESFLNKYIAQRPSSSYQLEDAKSYFQIKDGKVVVDEIKLNRDDIDITLSGSHSFDQMLDYTVKASIPGTLINQGAFSKLPLDLSQLNFPFSSLTNNAIVQLAIDIQGKSAQPRFSVKDVSVSQGGQTTSIVTNTTEKLQESQDSLISMIKDTITLTGEDVLSRLDSVVNVNKSQLDSTLTNIKDSIETTITSLEDLISKEREEIRKGGPLLLDSLSTQDLDSIKQRFEDIFKKKTSLFDSLKSGLPKKPKER